MNRRERLQKVLSQAGIGSRREMEQWIDKGWIKVNGKVATLGDSASAEDKITVKGKLIDNPLRVNKKLRVLLYNKPVGEIASRSDPEHKKTVFDNLPFLKRGRWVQVGRLDINTSGLMIFTNDGALANQMMHPRYQLEREYAVRIHGEVTQEMIKNLKQGVELDDGMAKFQDVVYRGGEGSNHWYHVILTEGRNREVRRLWASQGVEVSRLIRVRFGPVSLPRFLARGKHCELNGEQLESLMTALNYEGKAGSVK